MEFRRPRARAVLFGSTLVVATILPGMGPAVAAPNLVKNPGFEKLSGKTPQCWTTFKTGEHAAKFAYAKGHGKRALKVTVGGFKSGERAIVQRPECAIKARPGQRFDLSVAYRSSIQDAGILLFRRDTQRGWVRWDTLPAFKASQNWAKGQVRTPYVPENTDAFRWGVALSGKGVLITDDYVTRVSSASAPACSDPAGCQKGRWTWQRMETPLRAIHSVLLHNGKVLLIAGSGSNAKNFKTFKRGTFKTTLYDPVTGKFKKIPTPVDLFCAGHVQLANGKVLVMGGTKSYPQYTASGAEVAGTGFRGLDHSYLFNPSTNRYERINNLKDGSWYPSATILGNGDVFSAGGNSADLKKAITPYVNYYSAKKRRWLSTAKQNVNPNFRWAQYPSLILMQDGRLFYTGSATYGDGIYTVTKDNDKTFYGPGVYNMRSGVFTELKRVGGAPGALRKWNEREYSASVLLPPAQAQKVLTLGGGNTWPFGPPGNEYLRDAHGHADVIDLKKKADPAYHAAGEIPAGTVDMDMPDAGAAPQQQAKGGKMYVSAVILPDGKVFETGGAMHLKADPVYEASMYDPKNEKFAPMAADPVHRMYHNSAILLPDGRVLAAGSEGVNAFFDQRLSLYSPPYLFKGPRPSIKRVSNKAWAYGSVQKFTVNQGIKSAALIRPAAVTHSSDPNQRFVAPEKLRVNNGTVSFKLTNNPNLAPPGWYMLFVVNAKGVPSIAKWVHVG